jgi:hypothetical protein
VEVLGILRVPSSHIEEGSYVPNKISFIVDLTYGQKIGKTLVVQGLRPHGSYSILVVLNITNVYLNKISLKEY